MFLFLYPEWDSRLLSTWNLWNHSHKNWWKTGQSTNRKTFPFICTFAIFESFSMTVKDHGVNQMHRGLSVYKQLHCQSWWEIIQKHHFFGWKHSSIEKRINTNEVTPFYVSPVVYHSFMNINSIIRSIIYTQVIWEMRLLWFSNQTIVWV